MIGKTSFSNPEPALFYVRRTLVCRPLPISILGSTGLLNSTLRRLATPDKLKFIGQPVLPHPRQFSDPRRTLQSMTAAIPVRIFRTFLALTVSLWMAGAGCMLGCGNTVIAAAQSVNNQTIIAGPSCHHATHDCCAKKNSSSTDKMSQLTSSLLSAVPERTMGECPLAVNATAVIASKAKHHTPEQARTFRTEPSAVDSINQYIDWLPPPVRFLNRAPTYLRCCVFLI